MTFDKAFERVTDRSLDYESRYQAFYFIFDQAHQPDALRKLILLIRPDQDLEMVEEISERLNPARIEGDQEVVDHLLKLLNFEGFEFQAQLQAESKRVLSSENSQASDVRLLALRLLPSVVFRDRSQKIKAVKTIYQFIDHSYEDREIGHALQALYEMGEKGDEFMDRVLAAIEDPHSFHAKVWAMSIMDERKSAIEIRRHRFSVVRALSQASWKKRLFDEDSDDVANYLRLSMSIMESGFGALGLKKALAPMLTLVERSRLVDPLPIQAVGTLGAALLERPLNRNEVGIIQQLRRIHLSGVGEARDLGDHEVANEFKVELIIPQLRRSGFKDLNESTGISEIRTLLDSGLLGLINPPLEKCRQLLIDLGKPF